MKQNVDTEHVVVRTCACNGVVERVRTSRVHAVLAGYMYECNERYVRVLVISKIMYEGKIVNLINLDVLSRRRAPLRAARASGRREVNRSFRVS